MSWGQKDVYYNPAHFGLTPVAELSFSDEDYEFDFRVVWKHEDGRLLTARDSGCSCPSPFEDFTSTEQLESVDLAALEREIEKHDPKRGNANIRPEGAEFLRRVREAI